MPWDAWVGIAACAVVPIGALLGRDALARRRGIARYGAEGYAAKLEADARAAAATAGRRREAAARRQEAARESAVRQLYRPGLELGVRCPSCTSRRVRWYTDEERRHARRLGQVEALGYLIGSGGRVVPTYPLTGRARNPRFVCGNCGYGW